MMRHLIKQIHSSTPAVDTYFIDWVKPPDFLRSKPYSTVYARMLSGATVSLFTGSVNMPKQALLRIVLQHFFGCDISPSFVDRMLAIPGYSFSRIKPRELKECLHKMIQEPKMF